MYNLTEEQIREKLDLLCEEWPKRNTDEHRWIMYGSAELIDKFNEALEEEVKRMMIMPNELEQRVIELREEDMSYHAIQLALGNPSKKFIKDTLRKFRPDLAGDVVKNYGRLR